MSVSIMSTTRAYMLAVKNVFGKNGSIQVKKLHIYKNLLGKVSFNLSDIGEGIREVTVKEWYVKEGDKVSQFDNICEVQSDKASVSITSRYDGVISKLHYKIDETAYVGKPLLDIEVAGGEIQEQPTEKPPEMSENSLQTLKSSVEEKEVSSMPTDTAHIQCIPSVRRLAKEHNLDLTKVQATGKNGRILKEDVLKYMGEPITQSISQESVSKSEEISLEADTIEPIKGFKKIMIKTMSEALKIPHFVYGDEIMLNEVSNLRKVLKHKHEMKISPLPFFIKAVSNALTRYPIINSSVDEKVENIIYHKAHNLGVAVDTAAGLAVPVIKNVQKLSITEISQEIQRYTQEGRKGKFSPADLVGGTFTLSNIGSIGGTHTKPVILPPQVAIMALGKSQVLPRFDEDQNVVAKEIVTVSVSADHRIVDGATMARFVQDVKRQLENPYLLFLNI